MYEQILGITREWGTGLSLPLYTQAITHLMGGEWKVNRHVQIHRDGLPLGRQKFHLVSDREAFEITALKKGFVEYESNLRKLLLHTSLDVIHWVNIDLKTVRFLSVEKGS